MLLQHVEHLGTSLVLTRYRYTIIEWDHGTRDTAGKGLTRIWCASCGQKKSRMECEAQRSRVNMYGVFLEAHACHHNCM